MSWFSRWFKNVVKPVFRKATADAVNVGLGIAVKMVVDVAANPSLVTNGDKAKAWAKGYLTEATAAGIAVATGSALNLLRETALETAKADGLVPAN